MVFWILVKIGDQVFRALLDTVATLSIVARHLLKTTTVAIRVGGGRPIQSLGGFDFYMTWRQICDSTLQSVGQSL